MNLTNKFSLDKIKGIITTPLGDITNSVILEEPVEKDVKGQFGKFEFSANGEAGIKIHLFNDPDDDNDHELAKELAIEKQISNGSCFLGYEISGKLKGGLKAHLDKDALGLSVVGEVTHTTFLKHAKSDSLAQSLADDIKAFNFLFDQASIARLEDHEAVALHAKGAIDFDAEVSISDTFTPLLSKISKIIGSSEPLALEIGMSASFNVNVSISDYFETVIQRRDSGNKILYAVSINKEFKSKKEFKGEAGVAAKFSNPEVLQDTIDKIIEKGEKGLIKELEKLRDKALDQLTSKQRALLTKGAELIGLNPEKHADKLLKKYFEKKDAIVEAIKTLVTSAITFSVSYTYEKSIESKSVLKAILTDVAVKKYLPEIVRLDVKTIYAASGDKTSGVTVKRYLDLSKVNIVKAMKIGFAISGFELSQLVKKALELNDVVMYDEEAGEVQSVSFSSSKFTTEKFGVFKERENSIVLTGSYEGPPKPLITMANLDFGFTLNWIETYRRVNDATLKSVLDFAVTWGIVDEAQFQTQLKQLKTLLSKRKKIKVSAAISLKEGLLDTLVDRIINLSDYTRYNILAASIPYADYSGRTRPSERKDLYYSFFDHYEKEKNPALIDYTALADHLAQHLRTIGKNELADFEDGSSNDPDYATMKTLLEHNFMVFQYDALQKAFKNLTDDTKHFTSILKTPAFTRNLNRFRLQPEFNMRFLGRLMLELSKEEGIADVVERSIAFEYNDGKKDQKFMLAR